MKLSIIGAVVAVLFSSVATMPQALTAQALPSVSVALVADGPNGRHDDIRGQLEAEIQALLVDDLSVTFIPADRYRGDWTAAGVSQALDAALEDPDVDLVVATGPIGGNLLVRRESVPRPVLAAFITGPLVHAEVEASQSSTIPNVGYVFADRKGRAAETLAEFFEPGRVALLSPAGLIDASPEIAARVQSFLPAGSPAVDVVPVGASADEALSGIDADVAAVVVFPLSQLSTVAWQDLVSGLGARSLPTFSWLGEAEVREGLLAGLTPDRFTQQLVRWAALNAQQMLLGVAPIDLPVSFPPQERLVINMETARLIDVSPSWSTLISAELIGEQVEPVARRLSLDRAMSEALDSNLDLAAEDRFVAAGEDNVRLATAPLLPQVDLLANATAIDEDRAEFGAGPERSFSSGAAIRQLIFDEPAWANRSVERSLQESRVQDREALRLDVARDAGVAYLSLLRAKTFERIERDNLSVTTTNLDFAQLRVSSGAASRSEVFRWQTQVANNRQRVIDTEVVRSVGELDVNRILNRELEERFETDEATLADPAFDELLSRVEPYIDNPRDFDLFRQFMTEEALAAAPELRGLDALTAAQNRILESASRSFFLPSVALEAGVNNLLSSDGAGSADVPGLDDWTWQTSLVFSYPLFSGTAKFAAKDRATEDLTRIQIQRDAAAQRVEQRVRSVLHLLRGSWVNIELARAAADASANNFQLVQDAYRRGVGDILNLLDAQNEALVADLSAASAVYDFLTDLIEVQRSVGRFQILGPPPERDAFFSRLDAFYSGSRN